MRAFQFDQRLIENYERFSRSFSIIQAPDLAAAIEQEYADGRFWPDALLSLNPRYKEGPCIDALAADGALDEATARGGGRDGGLPRGKAHGHITSQRKLPRSLPGRLRQARPAPDTQDRRDRGEAAGPALLGSAKIGRASCRERV